MPPDQSTEVTLGEVNRNVTSLMGKVDTLTQNVAAGPDWADVRRIEAGIIERVTRLEDNHRWITRAVLALVLAAVIGGVLITR